jgi:hypothetical protein
MLDALKAWQAEFLSGKGMKKTAGGCLSASPSCEG